MQPLKTKQQRADEQKTSNARERQIAKQYLQNGPSIQNLYNAFTHWYNSVPFLGGQHQTGNVYITGEVPTPTMRNPKSIIQPIKRITKANASKITPEQWTAAQDAAIARGDMAEAQRLRDLHFKVSAPNNTVVDNAGLPVHVYHGTAAKPFTIFDINASRVHDLGTYGKGFYFTPNKKTAINYGNGKHVFDSYLKLEKPYSGNMDVVDNVGNFRNLKELKNYYKQEGIPEKELNAIDWGNFDVSDGVNAGDEIMVLRPNQIKLADAVTYDNNGVRIPLGERDNFNIKDIRYAVLPFTVGSIGYGLYNTYDR